MKSFKELIDKYGLGGQEAEQLQKAVTLHLGLLSCRAAGREDLVDRQRDELEDLFLSEKAGLAFGEFLMSMLSEKTLKTLGVIDAP